MKDGKDKATDSVYRADKMCIRDSVTVDGKEYTLNFKDALYVGRGKQKVTFKSKDASKPAKFYINSATAHKEYKTQLITIDGRKGSLKANSFAARCV